jgi:site-specific DNA recombinase
LEFAVSLGRSARRRSEEGPSRHGRCDTRRSTRRGRAYGYRAVPGKPGELEIVEDEAKIVRAFSQHTPRDERLGTLYTTSTEKTFFRRDAGGGTRRRLIATPQRGSGLIFNELYAGRIVWNKVRMVKNHDTGKRLFRPNPRDEWQSIEAPQVRIVEQSIWEQAHALKSGKGQLASHVERRAPHLLSGLLRCGCCGSGMSVHDRDKTGKTRIRCSAVRESGNCSNRGIIYLRDIERLVLSGMAEACGGTRLRCVRDWRRNVIGSKASGNARLIL